MIVGTTFKRFPLSHVILFPLCSSAGFRDISHGGLVSGYRSLIQLFPDKRIGLYLTVNGPNTKIAFEAMYALKAYTADLALGLEPWLNETTACTYPQPWAEADIDTSATVANTWNQNYWGRNVADFEGVYSHLGFGNVTITFNVSNGFFTLKHGRLGHGVLHPQERNYTFKLLLLGVLEYVSNEDGRAEIYIVEFYEQAEGKLKSLTTGYLPATIHFHRRSLSGITSDAVTSVGVMTSQEWAGIMMLWNVLFICYLNEN